MTPPKQLITRRLMLNVEVRGRQQGKCVRVGGEAQIVAAGGLNFHPAVFVRSNQNVSRLSDMELPFGQRHADGKSQGADDFVLDLAAPRHVGQD